MSYFIELLNEPNFRRYQKKLLALYRRTAIDFINSGRAEDRFFLLGIKAALLAPYDDIKDEGARRKLKDELFLRLDNETVSATHGENDIE